jgi:hypothetical protein
MRRERLRFLAFFVLYAFFSIPVSCGHAPSLRVDPQGYYTHGYYLGSRSGVKAFVERLTSLDDRHGTIVAEIAILNERPAKIRFFAAENALSIDGRRVSPEDSHAIFVPPGEIARVPLRFRTKIDGFDRATLEITGIEAEPGQRVRFEAPIYAVEDDDAPEPPPMARGNRRGA